MSDLSKPVYTVSCPTCHAKPGELCVLFDIDLGTGKPTGERRHERSFPHEDRIWSAKRATGRERVT